jgi:hypothetical protein
MLQPAAKTLLMPAPTDVSDTYESKERDLPREKSLMAKQTVATIKQTPRQTSAIKQSSWHAESTKHVPK